MSNKILGGNDLLNAENLYDFRKHPFKGVVFVGESVEFPSKDPHSTGAPHRQKPADGIPNGKMSPGWYPCYDYAQWIALVRDTIRHDPQCKTGC